MYNIEDTSDMENIISKEIVKKMVEMKGEVRGIAIRSHGEFIIKEKGEEGLGLLEEEMKKLGHPIKYKKIRPLDFYPIGLEGLTLLSIKKLFNFSEEKFIELGEFQTKVSLILKLFMRYFASIKMTAEQAPRIWEKYYTVGKLELVGLDEKKKVLILRLKDFYLHPLHCLHLKGYCAGVVKMIVKAQVTCEEIKCIHRGDDYHEFLLKW